VNLLPLEEARQQAMSKEQNAGNINKLQQKHMICLEPI